MAGRPLLGLRRQAAARGNRGGGVGCRGGEGGGACAWTGLQPAGGGEGEADSAGVGVAPRLGPGGPGGPGAGERACSRRRAASARGTRMASSVSRSVAVGASDPGRGRCRLRGRPTVRARGGTPRGGGRRFAEEGAEPVVEEQGRQPTEAAPRGAGAPGNPGFRRNPGCRHRMPGTPAPYHAADPCASPA